MVLLDESGAVVRDAKLWCDVEAAEEARIISVSGGFVYVSPPSPPCFPVLPPLPDSSFVPL